MRTTIIAAAALAATTGTAIAEAHMTSDNLIRTRDITGGEVYSISSVYDETTWMDDAGYGAIDPGWTDIGEIEDVVLDRTGQMIGVVAEVGGFLDIADKHVVIEMTDIKLVPIDDQTYGIVTRLSEEQLEQLEGVDEGFWN